MCTPYDVVKGVVDVVRVVLAVQDYRVEKAETEYKRQLITKQAKKAENDAAFVRQEGIEEARRKRLNSILEMGKAKTDIAAGNIDLYSQMAINIVDDEKLNGELDALNTLKNSEHQAENYTFKAQQHYANAGLTSFLSNHNSKSKLVKSLGQSAQTFAKTMMDTDEFLNKEDGKKYKDFLNKTFGKKDGEKTDGAKNGGTKK